TDDLSRVVEQARASASVTHAHPDGQAGAVAIAVAAACAWQLRDEPSPERPAEIFAKVLERVPDGPTRRGIVQAAKLPLDLSPRSAARLLGDGSRVICWDTVPFTLWCAARHLDDYAAALWSTVAGLGDRDTTCAIVGGIVALSAGVPEEWRA